MEFSNSLYFKHSQFPTPQLSIRNLYLNNLFFFSKYPETNKRTKQSKQRIKNRKKDKKEIESLMTYTRT